MEYNDILSIITIPQNCLTNNKIRAKNFENKPNFVQIQRNKGIKRGSASERCSTWRNRLVKRRLRNSKALMKVKCHILSKICIL